MNKIENIKTTLTYDDVLIKPSYSEILPLEVDLSAKLTDKLVLKIPVISATMDTVTEYEMARAIIINGGIGVLHKNAPIESTINTIKKLSKEFGDLKPIAASVGVSTEDEGIDQLIKAGANIIVVDSAHGHSYSIGKMVEKIAKKYPNVFLIAGNIVSKDAAKFLIEKGANAVKVGVGPGAICTTRVVTGVGAGQISSINEVAEIAKSLGAFTIADGGMKQTGDLTKAIVAGADMVMLGSMLAGSDETPGEKIEHKGKLYKSYRGMGSLSAMQKGSADRYNQSNVSKIKLVPEGIEGFIKCKGPVSKLLVQITGGIKNGLGYIGAKDISEAYVKGTFVRITSAGFKISNPHTLDKIMSTTNFKK